MATTATFPEVVEGPDLVLRAWQPSDVDALAASVTRSVAHLRPWMPWAAEEPLSREARLALIDGWALSRREPGGDAVYGAFRDAVVVGGCGLHRRRGPQGLEIGYWVDVDHLRQGIATSMARLLTVTALRTPGVTFVEIHHDKANIASGGVPERLGYRLVAEAQDVAGAPGETGVDCTWRVTAEEWHARH